MNRDAFTPDGSGTSRSSQISGRSSKISTTSNPNSYYDEKNDYKRYLGHDWDIDFEGLDFIFDKSLYEFPVFSLNQDYLKALAIVLSG